jgi:hypothetical protein
MIVHDTRLSGNAPRIAQNIYKVDATTDISHCIGWIRTYAQTQTGLDELLIMCHGYEAHWDLGSQSSTLQEAGGFGLQLCKDGLSLYNASLVRSWNGLINRITIYACAVADTGSGNEGTAGDGRRLMGEIALYSGAEVIASSKTQYYSISWWSKQIDFGKWEGPVYRFDPDTGRPSQISPGPMS